ncbi:FAD-dependent oxidoreductase, partial [Sutterella wadsworthensis]
MTDISRRKLFGAAGAASLGLAGMVPVASASECGKPVKWNETKEFVIIGTGFAGLAAALEAHQGGMKSDQILILEKMSFPGGNSVINGGAVAAAGTDMQKAEGIKDSPDLLYADIIKAGGGLAHPELARHIADESVENFYWLRDKIGVKFKAVTYHGGHSVKRSHAVESNSGAGFILPMLERLKEVGIKPQLRTKVEQLIVNDKGCVEGVKARTGY